MQCKASTVEEYLADLPEDRRTIVEAVRKTILANLPGGYQEAMQYGMIGYSVPHRLYPAGYHCDPRHPLPFAGLASQKRHLSLYVYALSFPTEEGRSTLDWLREEWAATGLKLDVGKSCIRFKKIADLSLPLIGDLIRRYPVEEFVTQYERSLPQNVRSRAGHVG